MSSSGDVRGEAGCKQSQLAAYSNARVLGEVQAQGSSRKLSVNFLGTMRRVCGNIFSICPSALYTANDNGCGGRDGPNLMQESLGAILLSTLRADVHPLVLVSAFAAMAHSQEIQLQPRSGVKAVKVRACGLSYDKLDLMNMTIISRSFHDAVTRSVLSWHHA
jgi:hypothetical protein